MRAAWMGGSALALLVALFLYGWSAGPGAEPVGPVADPASESGEEGGTRGNDAEMEGIELVERGEVAAESPSAPPSEPVASVAPFDHAVRGLVVDETGKPVVAAQVFVSAVPAPGRATEFRDVTRTSLEGTFGFFVPDPEEGGALGFEVRAAGFALQTLRVPPPYPKVLLRLERAMELVGHVRSDDSEPLAHAPIELFRVDHQPVLLATTSADASGNFRFADVPEGATLKLAVGLPERQHHLHSLGIVVSAPMTRSLHVDVVVPAVESVPLRIFDAGDGSPVAGAELRSKGFVVATSDSAGRAALRIGKEDRLELEVRAQNYCGVRAALRPADTKARPIDLPLVRACRIDGKVVDESGQPMAGLYVHAECWGSVRSWLGPHAFRAYETIEREFWSFTDAAGEFTLDGIVADDSPLTLRARRGFGVEKLSRTLDSLPLEIPGTRRVRIFRYPVRDEGELHLDVYVDGQRSEADFVIYDAEGERYRELKTSDRRTTEIRLRAGDYRVDVEADAQTASETFLIQPDEVTKCLIHFESRPPVVTRGTVVDEFDAPVGDFELTVIQRIERRTLVEKVAAGAGGRFSVVHYVPDAAVELMYEDAWQKAKATTAPGAENALLRIRRLHDVKLSARSGLADARGQLAWRSATTGAAWQSAGDYVVADHVVRLRVPAGPVDLRFTDAGTGRVAMLLGFHPERPHALVELAFEAP